MKNRDLFGKTFECECGMTHRIDPREVCYGDDAFGKLPEVCARAAEGRRVAVLMDVRTRAAAGAEAAAALAGAGWAVEEVLVDDPAPGASPVCDDLTREIVEGRLRGADLILTVGGGVMTDLGKWVGVDAGVPFVAFATAASMNGFASSNIAPTIDGLKSLVYGHAPLAVVSSPTVLQGAPYELTASGLGDVLAKSVSTADWYMNHRLFGDYYCTRSIDLIADIEPMYLNHPDSLAAGTPLAMAALFYGLLLTGVAMTMADTSFPSSGGEHLISHSLDMMSSVDGEPHDLHGRQVGLGTILGAALYHRVLAIDSPEFVAPAEEIDRPFWGKLADDVAAEYARKADRLHEAGKILARGSAWDDLREALSGLLTPPETLRDCLARAGGAYRAEDIDCPPDRLAAAVAHAHEIRSRFTILDLARLVGLGPADVEDLLTQWA